MSTEDANFITAEIVISEKNINKDIRIINSYEEFLKTAPKYFSNDESNNNEEEIKMCEIKINDKSIPFSYLHKFDSKGAYTIKYLFKNKIANLAFIFAKLNKITKIDLSKFNTINVTNMMGMFYECSSLESIDLSNINTSNVTDMNRMFADCCSLTSINLSNFNTCNVTDMSNMFYRNQSLTNIDLSNFDK